MNVHRSTASIPPVGPPQTEAERLRKVARDLEGVFVEQMFKAMRETVPEGGVTDGGSGEAMFTGMLDQHLSAATPARWEHGLAEVLYRQLAGRLPAGAEAAAAAPMPAPANPHSSPSTERPILSACAPPATEPQ
jgi:flagellar protein FlgJ